MVSAGEKFRTVDAVFLKRQHGGNCHRIVRADDRLREGKTGFEETFDCERTVLCAEGAVIDTLRLQRDLMLAQHPAKRLEALRTFGVGIRTGDEVQPRDTVLLDHVPRDLLHCRVIVNADIIEVSELTVDADSGNARRTDPLIERFRQFAGKSIGQQNCAVEQ